MSLDQSAAGTDPTGLTVLDDAECLRLLASVRLGRIAVSDRALPTVLPVYFLLTGRTVLLRVAGAGRLAAATRTAVVAFEADEMGPTGGWSVLGIGRTRSVRPDERVAASGLRKWGTGEPDRFVAIGLELLTGRRLPLPTG
ncbi:MAG TPA: pyridoxamine 5'-phosphate oxidase family protein [Kutzneria sp.]|jgi:nitroimidazol reductase NimA-like FMN-containing flavoprotein (pyridoxamine 5'-phosphate oxidase superfamily)|nr:pyridoxamine 5'-phosphate oxidase family protein [Kutzneria sp.]